jgi:uncharacterized protein YbjT (DUF2867 family)
MFVVAGVTGNVGSVAADLLLSQGHAVRVIVRDAKKGEAWKARGAEVAVANLDDAAALTKALEGAKGAFLLNPPAYDATDLLARQALVTDAIGKAVEASKIGHVVFLSSVGAQHDAGTGPIVTAHRTEERLRKTGAKRTFLRACYFMENAANNMGMLAQGVYATFNALDYPFPQIATKDIGVQAAKALVEGAHGDEEILELVGPRDVSEREIGTTLGKLLGKELQIVQGPIEKMVETLAAHGLQRKTAELFHEMTVGSSTGHVAFDGKGKRIAGVTEPTEVLQKLLARGGGH